MQKLIGFNIKRNKKLLVSDIIKFFEVRGYVLTDADAKGMVFRRGKILGNFFSLNPIRWRTKVDIEIIKKERMDYDIYAYYHFSTFGHFISQEEDDFFTEEVSAFSKAIQDFDVDVDQVEQLAIETSKSNYSYMLKALPIGVFVALLLIFLANVLMEGRLPILVASCITVASILLTYYLLTRIKAKHKHS